MKFTSKKDIWLVILFWVLIIVCFGSVIPAILTENPSIGEGIIIFICLPELFIEHLQ